MRTIHLPLFCCVALSTLVSADVVCAHDSVPAGRQEKPLLFVGGTIHPVSGVPIREGKMLVIDGRISNVTGPDGRINLPQGTVTVDCTGKHLYPGMIAANSTLGRTEIRAVESTLDLAEEGIINPSSRAQVTINPDSELIPVTRANGVLAALTIPHPKGDGLITGQSALFRLDGWTWEDMTISSTVGMHVFWPELRTYPRWSSSVDDEEVEKLRKEYGLKIKKIEMAFESARAYQKATLKDGAEVDTDLRWEALAPVLDGKLRLFVHARTTEQIRSALHFCEKQKIGSPVIVGGNDAWRVVAELKEADASVILSPVNSLPLRRWEAYDTPYTSALKLHEAGVRFCIANDGKSFSAANERNLPYQAGRAAAHGLPLDVALKSVTLFPAQILGVGDRLGSIQEGKEATFFISDGDPLEVMTSVEAAFVLGGKVDLSSKHTRLYEKYKEKYRQLQEKEN